MYRTIIDEKVNRVFGKFSRKERSHIQSVIELFEERGFDLTQTHLKKLTKNLWELRSGNMRILFGMNRNIAVVVNIFRKKTNKTPKYELELAIKRLIQYEK